MANFQSVADWSLRPRFKGGYGRGEWIRTTGLLVPNQISKSIMLCFQGVGLMLTWTERVKMAPVDEYAHENAQTAV
jgi:hypothetical protein